MRSFGSTACKQAVARLADVGWHWRLARVALTSRQGSTGTRQGGTGTRQGGTGTRQGGTGVSPVRSGLLDRERQVHRLAHDVACDGLDQIDFEWAADTVPGQVF